jgi:hypothetical protein
MLADLLTDFERESLYTRDAWFVHRLLELDVEGRRLVAELDTTRIGPLVDAQREVAGHPKHLPAAVVIQLTGTMGQLYAVYGLGLRPTEGWHGFGTHITKARFPRIGVIGPAVTATATCTRQRQLRGTWFCDFSFSLEQHGKPVYVSEQTAAWVRDPEDVTK